MEFSPSERDYLAAAIYGEARGESEEGQQAVAWAILNRAAATGQTIEQVVRDASANGTAQFTAFSPNDPNRQQIERAAQLRSEPWTAAQRVASEVLLGNVPDPTGGAVNYYSPRTMRLYGRTDPSWGRGHPGWREHAEIGGHVFGRAAGGVPNPPNASALPPLNFGRQPDAPMPSRAPARQPNPATDFNRQELAAIAPPTPATATQMATARSAPSSPQVGSRDLQGYMGQMYGVPREQVRAMIAPGASARAQRGIDGLTDQTVERLAAASALLPANNQPRITSTVRNDRFRTHNSGGAVDLRNRDLTPFQEAQQVAALARSGFEAIGPYANGRFPAHIHVGDNPIYNRPGSRFQAPSRTDNPYLSGTQPNSGLYDAVDFGSHVSNAWFGPTAPTPTRNVQPRNMGDGSLDAAPGITPRPAARASDFGPMPTETGPRLSETYRGAPAQAPSASSFPARPSYTAPSASSSSSPSARIDQAFNDALSPRSMPTPVARVSPAGSYGTSSPRRSPDQFQYVTRTREVPNPAYRAPSSNVAAGAPPQATPLTAHFSSMAGANYRSPVPAPQAPGVPRTITETYRVRVPVPSPPQPLPAIPQFGMVPNPMARPANLGRFGPVASPMPRSRARSVPNPMAAPNAPRQRNLIDVAGFNDWIGSVGNAIASPFQALGAAVPRTLVQGANLPSQNTPNWQDTSGLPTYASVTGRSAGGGASAFDAWADSLGSAFY